MTDTGVRATDPTRVLIIDDHADTRKMIEVTLAPRGFDLAQAPDSDSAMSVLEDFHPHLVLLDVVLPGSLDGLGLCQQIRSSHDHGAVKIVFISGLAQRGDVDRMKAAHADGLIIKPFGPTRLLDEIKRVLS